jgi:hypothetical protein
LARQRHQSASNQPELLSKLLTAVDPGPEGPGFGIRPIFHSIGFGEAAMKQTVIWLALALLFALGVTLSFTADSFGPTAAAETTGSATLVESPKPIDAASAKPAEPEVPVAMLDDVPLRPTIGSESLARWFVEPGASLPPRTAEALVAPAPLAPATAAAFAGPTRQDSSAAVTPPEGEARPVRKPKASSAQLPTKRRTANAKTCGSQGRFSDLLRQLKLVPRCSTRRVAA